MIALLLKNDENIKRNLHNYKEFKINLMITLSSKGKKDTKKAQCQFPLCFYKTKTFI